MLTLDQVFSINLVENELTNRFSSSQDSLVLRDHLMLTVVMCTAD